MTRSWGGPDVLSAEQVPDPVARAGEVIVELRASALNWHDVIVRRGGATRGLTLPRILGCDGAGTVRGTGEEVVVLPSLSWGDSLAAPDPSWHILGDKVDGTYAELVRVPAENVFPKPGRLSWRAAAAIPLTGLTAYRALFTRAQLKPGESLLVCGAGGGVATMAISLAASIGARVFVTSTRREAIATARELGAQAGALSGEPGWVEEIKGQTGGGVDVILDGIGAGLAERLGALRPGGRIVVLGASGGSDTPLDIPQLYFGQYSILGTSVGGPTEFRDFLEVANQGTWEPAIDSTWSIDTLSQAHERIESRHSIGKLVLDIR